jgi:very-short-patch-repair endonuclease
MLPFRDTSQPIDVRISGVAARQHELVTLAQLVALGLSASAVRKRARAGRLHRVFRGVYAVGSGRLTPRGHWLAAVLACGEGAVLSHLSAAGLWEIDDALVVSVHVTAATNRRSRPGLVVHRHRLTPADVTLRAGIPVTVPLRTLRDLPAHAYERAAARAVVDRLVAAQSIAVPATRSGAERRFLRLWRDRGLPHPEVNVVVEGHECDFVWREARLVVELDGPHHDLTRRRDYERDRRLTLAGWRVLRFGADDVEAASDGAAAALDAYYTS